MRPVYPILQVLRNLSEYMISVGEFMLRVEEPVPPILRDLLMLSHIPSVQTSSRNHTVQTGWTVPLVPKDISQVDHILQIRT